MRRVADNLPLKIECVILLEMGFGRIPETRARQQCRKRRQTANMIVMDGNLGNGISVEEMFWVRCTCYMNMNVAHGMLIRLNGPDLLVSTCFLVVEIVAIGSINSRLWPALQRSAVRVTCLKQAKVDQVRALLEVQATEQQCLSCCLSDAFGAPNAARMTFCYPLLPNLGEGERGESARRNQVRPSLKFSGPRQEGPLMRKL